MKKKSLIFVLILILILNAPGRSYAALPTFDAVNAALSELRNSILDSGFVREIQIALEKLEELKATYQELIRFHGGLDDIVGVLIGDPIKKIFNSKNSYVYEDSYSSIPKIELFDQAQSVPAIRSSLEAITGDIPDSPERPYIPFEEMQVVRGYEYAREIRNQGASTREAAELMVEEAKSASPKGAARLTAQAGAQLMVLAQENQEALAKLIELDATQVEQVSREEKRLERERLRHREEMLESIKTLGRFDS